MNFTDETIKAELAVCEAATGKPWKWEPVEADGCVRETTLKGPTRVLCRCWHDDEKSAEAVYVEHACNNYEAALKELLELRRVNAMLEAHVDEARSEQYAADENAAYLEEALRVRDDATQDQVNADGDGVDDGVCFYCWCKDNEHDPDCPIVTHPIGGKDG